MQLDDTQLIDQDEQTEETSLDNAGMIYVQSVVEAMQSYGQNTAQDYDSSASAVAESVFNHSLFGSGSDDYDLGSSLAQAQSTYAGAEIFADTAEQQAFAQAGLSANDAIDAVMQSYVQDTDSYDPRLPKPPPASSTPSRPSWPSPRIPTPTARPAIIKA